MTETKPKRHWFRFSLLTMFVVVTVLCVWLGFKVNAAKRQKEAVNVIRKAGGGVRYNYQPGPERGKLSELNPDPPPPLAPMWLRTWLGDDCFCSVVGVAFSGHVDASTLRELTKLSELKWVQITMGKRFNASEVESLGDLSSLRELSINGGEIDGRAIASLTKLKQLKILKMKVMIDDVGMEQLGKLTTIEYLYLFGNKITESGYSHLQKIANVNTLIIESANIRGRTLQYLANIRNLKSLEFRNCFFFRDSDGLKQFRHLSELGFDGSDLSPSDIRELQATLSGTKVSGP